MADGRRDVHLRMLTADDAPWLVAIDAEGSSDLVRVHDWNEEKLAADLDGGMWATHDRWGWAIVVDGEPVGFALVTDIASGDAAVDLRITREHRGRGVGREILRQLADHHFAATPRLTRLAGRTHEHNVPMQRAFNAAGFRMEARYRDSFELPDGGRAAEWGYALTRTDWERGRHRLDHDRYDLHGLTFVAEEAPDDASDVPPGALYKFLQEGRRVLARYQGGDVSEGELAGVLLRDVVSYRYVHDHDGPEGHRVVTGGGQARLQRRQDGRLELVSDWTDDDGWEGSQVLVERR